MVAGPSFHIPQSPARTYPFSGGVEYEGTVVFAVTPADTYSTEVLAELLRSILADGPYRYGDFFNLPMPLYLVKDRDTKDVFRVSIRDGGVRFHVLPSTESPGLENLYERLADRTETNWHVERRVEAGEED